jgi:hypothetical protein
MMVGEPMTIRPRRFILQAIHPDYACPAFETMFETDRPDELRALLGPDAEDDADFAKFYWLEPGDLTAIRNRFGVRFDASGWQTTLRKYTGLRDVPYLVHTDYELPLMLDGRKKLARMSQEYPPHRHLYEDRFDHYVARGLLHKEVDVEPFGERLGRFDGLRTVYYTPKGEEWRVRAWRLVEQASKKTGWNETLERLEGMLFGYEDWQSDWWAEHWRKKRHQFGSSLVYVGLSPIEIAAVETAGFRSLPVVDRSLMVVSSSEDDLTNEERRQLTAAVHGAVVVRFRVKTRALLELVGTLRDRDHRLRSDQIKDLNGLILEKIEIV